MRDMADTINHPSHYAAGRQHEPIDVIEDWELGFNLGNAVKYISRAGRKGDPLEDLRKAAWYLEREIQRLTRQAARGLQPGVNKVQFLTRAEPAHGA